MSHRRINILLLAAAFAGCLGTSPQALAGHSSGPFEIDGNATDDDATSGADWSSVIPFGGAAETFVVDEVPPLGTETFFTGGGSKDDNDLSEWKTVNGGSANPDKDNITNAYAKAYSVDHDSDADTPAHLVIYFGADRFANSGDAALGFWFFKNDVKAAGNGFTGLHSDDDILVQVDFVQGGVSSEIQIFRWRGDGSGTHGKPKKTLKEIKFAAANGATVCTNDDTACATTNQAAGIDAPWDYTPKTGTPGEFPSESFFEGFIDVTALVGDVCFSSFVAETRSSHAETATLKDLALGDFNLCSIAVTKSCPSAGVDPDGETINSTHVVTITNDGFGEILDVGMRDDAVNADDTCTITAISGGTTNPAVPITIQNNQTFYEVADKLASGQSVEVTLSCNTDNNPFINSVSVRARPSPTAEPDTLTASYMETTSDIASACIATFNPALEVTKTCQKTTLDGIQPLVCADITVKNTSSPPEKLTGVTVTNTLNDGTKRTLLSGGTLNPGEVYTTEDCYEPAAPDNNQTNPCLAGFTDTVKAGGAGLLSGQLADGMRSATCPLCDCTVTP